MAKIKVSAELISEMLFGFTEYPTAVAGCDGMADGVVIFEVEGLNVPNCDAVTADITIMTNRAGDRLRTLKFRPI